MADRSAALRCRPGGGRTATQTRRAARTYHGFARLISVSHYTLGLLQRALGERALPDDKVLVVPNCVESSHYVERRDLGARPWHDRDFILTIGEVKERKGLHLALAGFLAVADQHPALAQTLSEPRREAGGRAACRRAPAPPRAPPPRIRPPPGLARGDAEFGGPPRRPSRAAATQPR